jgi:SAM-dependent methyltransferase
VLDVGGTPGALAGLLPGADVVVANVDPPADVLLSGPRLPFEDAAFDAVTSVDVLEHIPPPRRGAHVRELRRVARHTVVVCCPVASPGHDAAEAELAEWYRRVTGRPHRFLEEHLANGLPTATELEELGDLLGAYELRFHGDYRAVQQVFRFGVLARRRPWRAVPLLGPVLHYTPSTELADRPAPTANRAFLSGTITRPG